MEKEKPYWWPDAQGFAIGAIIIICAAALFVRMFSPSNTDDKMLDTMITILFSTCLVAVFQYLFGSSRGAATKDETVNKIALMPSAPVPPAAPGSTTTTVTKTEP